MLLRGALQIDAKNSNSDIFESTLYMKSGSMPFNVSIIIIIIISSSSSNNYINNISSATQPPPPLCGTLSSILHSFNVQKVKVHSNRVNLILVDIGITFLRSDSLIHTEFHSLQLLWFREHISCFSVYRVRKNLYLTITLFLFSADSLQTNLIICKQFCIKTNKQIWIHIPC